MAIDLATIDDTKIRMRLNFYLKDSPTARARKAMFSGVVMTPAGLAQMGMSPTVLTTLAADAKAAGYTVERRTIPTETGGSTVEHQVMNPEAIDYDEALMRLAKAMATDTSKSKKKAAVKRAARARVDERQEAKEQTLAVTVPALPAKGKGNGKTPGKALVHPGHLPFTYINHGDHMLPIPALGAQVEVNILKKELDGTIRIGLMVEGVQWVADITDAVLTQPRTLAPSSTAVPL